MFCFSLSFLRPGHMVQFWEDREPGLVPYCEIWTIKWHQPFQLVSENKPLSVSVSCLSTRTTAPSRGYYVSRLHSNTSTYLLLGCIPRNRVEITHWKELPGRLRKPQVTWLWTCTICSHDHPCTFCHKKQVGKEEFGPVPFKSIQSD